MQSIPLHTAPTSPPSAAIATTQAELEMIHLAKGIRSVVGPSANLSPERVDEIVNTLLEAPQPKAAKPTVAHRARDRIGRFATVGQFCTNWACLAAVLLMVGNAGRRAAQSGVGGARGLVGVCSDSDESRRETQHGSIGLIRFSVQPLLCSRCRLFLTFGIASDSSSGRAISPR